MSIFSSIRKIKIKIPFFKIVFDKDQLWSIGACWLAVENSVLKIISFYENNPVLKLEDVKDRTARMVADPFVVYENGLFYMFFEVLSLDNGDIGLAVSKDGISWEYKKIVLDESFHLSYPCVFKYENNYYMIPESFKKKEIRLYKANNFPYDWRYLKTLMSGEEFIDSTIFNYNNKWWIFTNLNNATLKLYYSENFLDGHWYEHPQSPIIADSINFSRPAGNIVEIGDKLIRFAQDGYPSYGNSVRAFEIMKLTQDEYEERELKESPLLKASGVGWNRDGVHQISLQQIGTNKFLAFIDGKIISTESCVYIGNLKIKLPLVLVRLLESLLKN